MDEGWSLEMEGSVPRELQSDFISESDHLQLADEEHTAIGGVSTSVELDNDLLCPICIQIIRDAFITACGHCFCYTCITTHIENKMDCPCCRRFLTTNQVFPNFVLDKLVQIAPNEELRVFMVAGEVSGDNIGYHLMSSLKTISPFPLRFAGVGGLRMSSQGLESLFPMEEISFMGILELFPHAQRIRMKLKQTLDAAISFSPHVVVTIDAKGFSFRLLKQLRDKVNDKELARPLHFHYVPPSFWAWKGGEKRLKRLAEFVDHMFCILPFEEEVCQNNGINATFVGHPVLEDIPDSDLGNDISQKDWKLQKVEKFLSEHKIPLGTPIISVLPGSRLQEVARMLPIFSKTLELMKCFIPDITTIIHVAPNYDVKDYINAAANKWPVPSIFVPGESPKFLKYNAFYASNVALCTSGSVSLELHLSGLPCLVAYRANFLTEWLIRLKAKARFVSLTNILLDSAVIPELLFGSCKPIRLSLILRELMSNESLRAKQITTAEKVCKILRPLGTHKRPSLVAASTIMSYVMRRQQ